MKRLATPLLAALVLSAGAASAQTTFRLGLRGGANRALLAMSGTRAYGEYTINNSAVYAWQAGAVAEVNFGKVALQPGFLFSQKGTKSSASGFIVGFAGTDTWEATSTNRYNWLELPINVVYTPMGSHGIQLFAGPYLALAVGGHQTGAETNHSWTGTTTSSAFDQQISYGSLATSQRLDAGINFGVGYRQGPLQLQLGYGLGLRNLHQLSAQTTQETSFLSNAAYNRVAQLTGTYFFSL